MNATRVEADEAMSVLSSESSEGVDCRCSEADENETAGALPNKAGDALFDLTTETCERVSAEM